MLRAIVLASLAFAFVAPLAGADSVTYFGSTVVSSGCTAVLKAPNGMDTQTCFQVPAGSTGAAIEIIDAVFGPKGGFYAFDSRPTTAFCGSVDAPVPAGAKWLRVGITTNDVCQTASTGTTGTVTVEWA